MNVEIAQRLAELRRAKGYSQESLAHELGLSRQAISKWERAESSPDTDNLIALARLYDMSLDELLRMSPEVEEDAAFESEERAHREAQLEEERAAHRAATSEAVSAAAAASQAASSAAEAAAQVMRHAAEVGVPGAQDGKPEKGRWRSFPYWAVMIVVALVLTIAGAAPFSLLVFLTIPLYKWLAGVLDGASVRGEGLERAEKGKAVVAAALIAVVIAVPVVFLATGGWLGQAMRIAEDATGVDFFGRGSGGATAVATTLEESLDESAVYAASEVRGLDVTWQGGSVRVERGATDEVSVHASLPAGTYDMDPTGVSFGLRDDGTLVIDDGLPDVDNGLAYPDLQLVIQLPVDEGWTLDQVRLSGVVADVEVSGLSCADLSLEGVSGEAQVSAAVEKDLAVDTVSGDVTLAPAGVLPATVRIDTVSDDATLASAGALPAAVRVDTVSGGVTLDVPEGAGMRLGFDTVSGSFSDAVGADAASGDVLTYGDGSADVVVSTISGSLRVQ